jgi:large conductance mechanosensitive channel
MINDFKKFILRGNVIDLAVAVFIGAPFNSVITALVRDMLTPLITAVRSKGTDFSHLSFTVHGSKFMYGDFLNELVSFIIISTVIFVFVVQPINKLIAYSNRGREADEAKEKECPQCLSKIPKAAKRCAFCTSVLKKA